jgi:hypothetical protein
MQDDDDERNKNRERASPRIRFNYMLMDLHSIDINKSSNGHTIQRAPFPSFLFLLEEHLLLIPSVSLLL